MRTEFPLTFLDPGHRRVDFGPVGMRDIVGDASLRETVRTVQALEHAGFHRYWVGEHHTRWNSHSCPEVLLGILASQTSKIRLGSAGVLLPYTRPYKAAEAFRALGVWFPDRIDAGVAKGPGAEEVVRPFILRESGFDPEAFRADLAAFHSCLQPEAQVPIAPREPPNVQLWCHTGNPETIAQAAKLGMGIGIALFLWQRKEDKLLKTLGETIETHYLSNFEPSATMKKPHVAAVESMICLEQASIIERLRQLPSQDWGSPRMGTPAECLDQARHILDLTHATEFGLFQSPYQPDLVRRSCVLMAEAAGASTTKAFDTLGSHPIQLAA